MLDKLRQANYDILYKDVLRGFLFCFNFRRSPRETNCAIQIQFSILHITLTKNDKPITVQTCILQISMLCSFSFPILYKYECN